MMSVHQYIGESLPTTINNGSEKILGPVVWPAAMIPTTASFDHPCLLVELRANNNDSAGGPNSIPLPAEGDKNACNYGSFFWGSNDITQRNLSYGPAPAGAATQVSFAFLASNFNSPARFVEVVVNKGKQLARVPMTLTMEPLEVKTFSPGGEEGKKDCCCNREYILVKDSHLIIKCDSCEILELEAKAGTVFKHTCKASKEADSGTTVTFGATGDGRNWQLHDTLSTVGFARKPGQAFRMILSFVTPTDLRPEQDPIIRIYQRNDKKVITGGVALQLLVKGHLAMAEKRRKPARRSGRTKRGKRR